MLSTVYFMTIMLKVGEGLCTCKCCMSDACIMDLLNNDHDCDTLYMLIYFRYEYNDYFVVTYSIFHDNSANYGGAMYL
jgi:hypothetical protein